MARQGRADVLLVHDPESEKRLLEEGVGADRRLVMHNDFILAGPGEDPAKVRGMNTITGAFRKIAGSKAPFISRGDASGTDKRRTLNNVETKGGMAETLAVATGKKGYVLTDRATFLARKRENNLEVWLRATTCFSTCIT